MNSQKWKKKLHKIELVPLMWDQIKNNIVLQQCKRLAVTWKEMCCLNMILKRSFTDFTHQSLFMGLEEHYLYYYHCYCYYYY